MSETAHQQVLLELAVTLGTPTESGGPPSDLHLPRIARRLGCRAAAVLRIDEDGTHTVRVAPRALEGTDVWRDIVGLLGDLGLDGRSYRTLPYGEEVLHIVDLPGFGVLLLLGAQALPTSFLAAFKPIAGLLARVVSSEWERSQRTALQERLGALGSRQQGLLDALPFAAWLSDEQGLLLEVNDAFRDWSRCAGDEAIGRLAEQVLDRRSADIVATATATVLASGEGVSKEANDPLTGRTDEFRFVPFSDARGRVTGVVSFRIDETERVRTEQSLRFETGFRELLGRLALDFMNVPIEEIGAAVDAALAAVGAFVDVDRAYLFRYDFAAGTVSNTNEWVGDGVTPQLEALQDQPLELFPDWVEVHLAGRPMHIPSVADLPADSPTRQTLEAQGIKTLISLPITANGVCEGFVGFDSTRSIRRWSGHDQQLLAVLAELIANAIGRTERERRLTDAQIATESANASLELALHSSGGLLWDWDATTGTTLLSAELMEFLGYPSQPLGVDPDSVAALLPPSTYQAVLDAVTGVFEGRTNRFTLDTELRTVSGQLRTVRVRGALVRRNGVPVRMAGTLEDRQKIHAEFVQVTRRNALHAALAHYPVQLLDADSFSSRVGDLLSELGMILGASRVSILWLDGDAAVRSTHEWDASGVDSGGALPVPVEHLTAPLATLRQGEAVLIEDAECLPAERGAEQQVYRSAGIRSLMMLPLFVAGELTGALAVDHTSEPAAWDDADVNMLWPAADLLAAAFARLGAEQQLTEAREQAERSDRAKTRFLSMISHELRTPMNSVLGMTELVMSGDLTREQQHRLSIAHRSGRAMLSLLDDLMDVASIEAGALTLRPGDVHLRSLVEEVIALLRLDADERGLDLELSMSDHLPEHVTLDGARFRQVITNLVSNALKFTASGWVRVMVGEVGSSDGTRRLEVVVEDTGPGIPEDHREHIFEAFARVEPAEGPAISGTGLGLSIVRQLVLLHGGRVRIDGRSGGGTRVTVELPLHTSTQPALRPRMQAELPAGTRVLVAEDNEVNQEVLIGFLHELDCTVRVVANGAEAVAAVAAEAFDVVLMDCLMPGVDGLAATRQIRALPGEQAQTPIIAVTADVSEGQSEVCARAGMDGVVHKPFDRRRLHEVLRGVSNHGRASPHDTTGEVSAAVTPEESEEQAPPRVDVDTLRALARPGSSGASLARRLEALFAEHAPDYAAQIAQGAAAGDLHGVRLAAHTLKSNAATLGLQRLEESSRCLEAEALAGLNGETADPGPLAQEVQDELPQSLAALSQQLAAVIDGIPE